MPLPPANKNLRCLVDLLLCQGGILDCEIAVNTSVSLAFIICEVANALPSLVFSKSWSPLQMKMCCESK